MNDLDELTQYLQARADSADLGHTPLGVITRAGTRRRNRRRTLSTAGALTVGALGSVATVQVLSAGDSPRRVGTDPIDTAAPVTTGPPGTPSDTTGVPTAETAANPPDDGELPQTLADTPLVWNEVSIGSAEAITMFGADGNRTSAVRGPDGALYQASTMPGRGTQSTPVTLYRSVDGVSWAQAQDMMFEGRVPPSAIDGTRLYAISTTAAGAPADSADGTLFAAASSDGGASWTTTPLPYDLAAVRNTAGISEAHVTQRQAAANDHGVVIAAQAHAFVTIESLADRLGVDPAALQPDNGQGFIQRTTTPVDCTELTRAENEQPRARGGTMVADGRCVLWGDEVRRYSWADVGLTGDAEAARRGQLLLFHSADGGAFTRLDPPPTVRDAAGEVHLTASGDQFLLTVTSTPEGDAAQGWITEVFVSDDGEEWTALPPPEAATCGDVEASYLGRMPVLVVQACRGAPKVLTFRDGAWSAAELATFPDGTSWTGMAWRDVGPAGIAVALQIATPAGTEPEVDASPGYHPASQRWLLHYSRDGVAWSVVDLQDIVGDMSSRLVTGVRVTDTNVIVSLRQRLDLIGPDDPLPDVTVLVGTLQ